MPETNPVISVIVPVYKAEETLDGCVESILAQTFADFELLLKVVQLMLHDRSLLRVADVEQRVGVGRRRLQRLFSYYVGVSPKWVLSRYRMHDVVAALDNGYQGLLTDLAATYGWYDQAHFIREFSALIGTTPSAYRDGR